MKHVALLSASFLLLVSAAAVVAPREARSAPESAAWTVDPVHSHVLFKIKHLGASWSWGRFGDFTAAVQTDDAGADLLGASFTVKTESIDTGNAKRDQHLRSPDFFNAKQFPEIAFKSTGVKAAGEGAWDVTGDLALHGETKPVNARVVRVGTGKTREGAPLAGYEATLTVKRSDFGMTYGTDAGALGDEVHLTIAVEAARK
jgi:polyisoprenoid-binding protein YceI